jgi:hypothetical protein
MYLNIKYDHSAYSIIYCNMHIKNCLWICGTWKPGRGPLTEFLENWSYWLYIEKNKYRNEVIIHIARIISRSILQIVLVALGNRCLRIKIDNWDMYPLSTACQHAVTSFDEQCNAAITIIFYTRSTNEKDMVVAGKKRSILVTQHIWWLQEVTIHLVTLRVTWS